MKKITQILVIITLLFASHNTTAQVAGDLDTTFNLIGTVGNAGSATRITTSAIQSDGKIIVGGGFRITDGGGIARYLIARLNTDGTLDTTFNSGYTAGSSGSVKSIVIQPSGQIVIAGNFTSPVRAIRRINTDGTAASFGPTWLGLANSLAAQTDGKIIVVGALSTGPTIGCLRLNSDGTVDNTFTQSTTQTISSIAIQTDGKIIVGGTFTTYNGTTANNIARLNTDGTLDTTFTGGTDAIVRSIATQTDGKIIIGGDFTTCNGTTVNRIAKLNTDGTLDTTFTSGTGVDASIYSIATQTDGKYIIGGGFTSYNGVTNNRIARLNTDGTLDTTFEIGAGANSVVATIAIQSDGKIFVAGVFSSYKGIAAANVARIHNTAVLSTNNFEILSNLKVYPNPSSGIYNITVGENAAIEVYDILGKQMLSKKTMLGTSQLDMSHYNAGIYLLKVTNENNQSKTMKIIKQ